jgi:hypothetical protein
MEREELAKAAEALLDGAPLALRHMSVRNAERTDESGVGAEIDSLAGA